MHWVFVFSQYRYGKISPNWRTSWWLDNGIPAVLVLKTFRETLPPQNGPDSFRRNTFAALKRRECGFYSDKLKIKKQTHLALSAVALKFPNPIFCRTTPTTVFARAFIRFIIHAEILKYSTPDYGIAQHAGKSHSITMSEFRGCNQVIIQVGEVAKDSHSEAPISPHLHNAGRFIAQDAAGSSGTRLSSNCQCKRIRRIVAPCSLGTRSLSLSYPSKAGNKAIR